MLGPGFEVSVEGIISVEQTACGRPLFLMGSGATMQPHKLRASELFKVTF